MTGSLLVIAPHPDDELLGAAGIMARAQVVGMPIAIIVLTDGSGSDLQSVPERLSKRRRTELTAGLRKMLGRSPELLMLDERDGYFDSRTPAINEKTSIATLLADLPQVTVLVTDPADAHPDHKAAFGFASRLASAELVECIDVMPISQRIDGQFDPSGFTAQVVGELRERKAAALACHDSQITSNSGFTLLPNVLDEFCAVEYTRRIHCQADIDNEPVPASHFEQMFAKSSDPWGYDHESYEADRFARTIAALGGQRFTHALELGCANGALTSRLIEHCDCIVATDVSNTALGAAAHRLSKEAGVTLVQGQLPDEVPEGCFDLLMVSDMLYYLGLIGVAKLMGTLQERSGACCRMVISNYLGETNCAISGEMAAEIAIAHLPGWGRIGADRTDRLRIDILERI